MNTIVIDCGASFVKGALFCGGKKEREIKSPAPGASVEPLRTTGKIIRLRELVREMISELCRDIKESILCISNEMHGFLLTNEEGEPITDYISWQLDLGDTRMRAEELPISEAVLETGMPVRGGLPSSNLSWLLTHDRIPPKCSFYTLGDYLLRFLSKTRPKIHITNAAATGLFNLKKKEWDSDILGYIRAENVIFPQIVTDSAPEIVDFRLNKTGIHALPAIGDQQAALLGAGLKKTDTLSVNMGTGAQVSRLSDSPVFGRSWQVRPYFWDQYLLTIPFIPSGRAINVYFRFIRSVLERYGERRTDEEIWQGILASAEDGEKTGMKVDLGFFENAVNDSTRGSLSEIGENELTMENLFASVIDQMIENCLRKADELWEDRTFLHKLLLSGGITDRIATVRERFGKHFTNCEKLTAEGDTLEGLMKYAEMQMRS